MKRVKATADEKASKADFVLHSDGTFAHNEAGMKIQGECDVCGKTTTIIKHFRPENYVEKGSDELEWIGSSFECKDCIRLSNKEYFAALQRRHKQNKHNEMKKSKGIIKNE